MATDVNSTGKTKFSIDDFIEFIGWGNLQRRFQVIIGFLLLNDGMEIMILAIINPILMCEWALTPFSASIITTATFSGIALGTLLLGKLCDLYGRRKTLILSAVSVTMFGIQSTFSPNYILLVIARIFLGIFLASGYYGLVLFLEYCPRTHRGRATANLNVFWIIGMNVAILFGIFMLYFRSWRILLGLATVLTTVAGILCWFMWESIRFLNLLGKEYEVQRILQNFAEINGKTLPDVIIKEDLIEETGRFSDLFNKIYLKTTILMTFATLFSLFAYYGVIFLQPLLVIRDHSSDGTKDICAISCYHYSNGYLSLFYPGIFEISFSLLVPKLWDNLGRRKSALIFWTITSISFIILLSAKSSYFASIIIFCLTRSQVSAATATLLLYIAELYPTKIRGVSTGYFTLVNKIGSTIGSFVLQILFGISSNAAITFIIVSSFISFMAFYLMDKETSSTAMKDTD